MEYTDRHEIEAARRPRVAELYRELSEEIWHTGVLSSQLKKEVFLLASLSSGCRHCQSHGAYGLHHEGASIERIRDIWDFERSEHFTEAERAAYRFARDAGLVPNAVTPEHHADLREYYSNEGIAEMLDVIALSGWLNRWNDSLATVTDAEAVSWAQENLSPVGWDLGKHTGSPEEQRESAPKNMKRTTRPSQAEPFTTS